MCEADQQASEIITSDLRSDFHVFTYVDYVVPGTYPASHPVPMDCLIFQPDSINAFQAIPQESIVDVA